MVTTTADLNLHPDLNGNVKIFCSQYDNALREIVFTIYDGENLADLTGLTATVEGTKPDKYGYSYDATINTTNSTVTVTLVTQMTCVAGISHVEIVLYSGSYRVGTANFLLMVEEAGLSDDTIVSDSVIPGIHNIDVLVGYAQTYADNAEASALEAEGYAVGTQNGTEVESGSMYYENNAKYYCEHAFSTTPEGYEALVNQVSNTKSVIGSSYNASTNYAVGDRFAYNGVRYKVNVACIGITPPNANYYEIISVDEDTKELESNISTLNSSLTNLSDTVTNNGAHNLLNNTASTQTLNGITITINDDGSISLSGTASAECVVGLMYNLENTLIRGQSYTLTGGISSNVKIGISQFGFDTGSGLTFTANFTITGAYCWLQIASGTTVSTTIYPMLRLASDSDNTYQPYAMTNQELTNSLKYELALNKTIIRIPLSSFPLVADSSTTIDLSDSSLTTLRGSFISGRQLQFVEFCGYGVSIAGAVTCSISSTTTIKLYSTVSVSSGYIVVIAYQNN